MHQDDSDLEQRLSRFEAQLDRFSLTLHQWQQSQEHDQSVTPRDVDQRIRTLEETIDREAQALRRMHEEPLRQLQAQTASLRDICAAASQSVNGLDQAESHLAALRADLHLHLNELTRNLQALAADLRIGPSGAGPLAQGGAAAWPLERVVHLHNELRRSADGHSGGPSQPPRLAEASDGEESSLSAERLFEGRRRWYAAGAAAVIVLGLMAYGVRRIETRLNEAAAHVTAAQQQADAAVEVANREISTARETADRQIAEARESAQRAETIGGILTAPDLVRFNLTGGGVSAQRSSAQLLWSRTRGLVLSGSRLPAAPPDSVYQLWLWTNAEPVNAGLFAPDATGKATLILDEPPRVVGAVIGAAVTVEPAGGRPTPSGPTLLTRPAPTAALQP